MEILNEIGNKLVTAYSGASLLGEDGVAIVSGIAISTLLSLHNYLYNIYLKVGTDIAQRFTKVEVEETKNGVNAKVTTLITPTKGAVLVSMLLTPPLLVAGYELLRNENMLTKVVGATIVASATFAFGGAVTMMLYPDTKKALENFVKSLEEKVSELVKNKVGGKVKNFKAEVPVVENIYGLGELEIGRIAVSA